MMISGARGVYWCKQNTRRCLLLMVSAANLKFHPWRIPKVPTSPLAWWCDWVWCGKDLYLKQGTLDIFNIAFLLGMMGTVDCLWQMWDVFCVCCSSSRWHSWKHSCWASELPIHSGCTTPCHCGRWTEYTCFEGIQFHTAWDQVYKDDAIVLLLGTV